MTDKETIEKKLEKLAQAIGPDETLVENVMSRIDAKPIGESKRIKRRIIMKSPIAKFAASAAAVIILAILLGRSRENTVWAKMCKAFEKVRCVHVHVVGWRITTDEERIKEGTFDHWAKKPNLFRNDYPDQLIIDNGVEKLVLDKRRKIAELSDSEQDRFPKTIFAFVEMLRGGGSKLAKDNPILTKIPSECTDKVLVYDAYYEPRRGIKYVGPNNFKIWVDAQTLLVQRAAGRFRDNSPVPDITVEYIFDYEDIADEMFSLDVPEGYEKLPRKQRATFSGRVINEDGEPVSDAQVYIMTTFVSMHGRTDENGGFTLKKPMLPLQEKLMFPIFVRAFREDVPDKVAWTVLTDPEVDKELAGGVPICENVQFNIDPNAGGPDKCRGADNIVIRMQPALQITGTLADKANKPIAGGRVALRPVCLNKYKDGSFVRFPVSLCIGPAAVTDGRGRFVLSNLPKFEKGLILNMKVKAVGYVTGDIEVTLDGTPLQQGADCRLIRGGVSIKGLVTNAAGEPLPGYFVQPTVDGKLLGEVYCITENAESIGTNGYTGKDGRFELINCPAMEGLTVTASGSSKPPNWDFRMKNWKMSGEFVYYNEKTIDVGYRQGKKKYYVEIILDEPDTTIEVEVKDTDGIAINGLGVILQSDRLLSKFEAKTDENGKYIFHNLPWAKIIKLTINPAMQLSQAETLTEDEKQHIQKLQEYIPVIWEPIELSEDVKHYKVDVTLSRQGKGKLAKIVVRHIKN